MEEGRFQRRISVSSRFNTALEAPLIHDAENIC
jgi:hypothetical protein